LPLSRRKKLLFGAVTVTMSFAVIIVSLLVVDLWLHGRAERSAGLNRYGYRGPVAGRKQPGEVRVAMLGGSSVFGYGVRWNESIAAYLQDELRRRLQGPVTVLNLGYNNEGAYSFVPNLEDFAYLDYDVIVLYEGYNDLAGDQNRNELVYRRNSLIYRTTGYFPILPIYLQEKAMALRSGNANAEYTAAANSSAAPQTVFRPSLAQRTTASALDALLAMTLALDGQFAASANSPPTHSPSESRLGCERPWILYCESVAAAVRYGVERGRGVVVVSQPRVVGPNVKQKHEQQQASLAGMMARTFSGDRGVVWADLSGLIDLTNVAATFDSMHLTPEANAGVAKALVEPVISAMRGSGIQ
jgi:hypothetical protein